MGTRVIAGAEMIHRHYSQNLAQASQQEGPWEWAGMPADTSLRLSGEVVHPKESFLCFLSSLNSFLNLFGSFSPWC